MKKNMMMRIASVLMVLTLLTTCGISGTFAKYTTGATAADTARVAKWGIQIATWDTDDTNNTTSLFKDEYDNTVVAGNKTDSTAGDLLVAPGTANDTAKSIKFSIEGTAEVDLKLDFVMNVTSDIKVTAGDYLDWTTANSTTDKFTLDDDYYPVVFTLTQTKSAADGWATTNPNGQVIATGNLDDIKTAFNALSQNIVEANTALDEEWTLTWEWVFEKGNTDEEKKIYDAADTLLGKNATEDADETGVVTTLKYDISITATQIN